MVLGDHYATASCTQCKTARSAHLTCVPACSLDVLFGAVPVLYSRPWECYFVVVRQDLGCCAWARNVASADAWQAQSVLSCRKYILGLEMYPALSMERRS